MLDRGEDMDAALGDSLLELREGLDPAASRGGDLQIDLIVPPGCVSSGGC